MKTIALVGFVGVVAAAALFGCAPQGLQPTGADVRSQIAEAYGIQSFNLIQKLQYTYNQKDGESVIRRFWIWEPAEDRVTFQEGWGQKEIAYRRGEVTPNASDELKQVDQWFIHDNFWLLFPFRAAWDHQAEVADMGSCRTPLDGLEARCVNVVYPATQLGRVIGDTFKLYVDPDFRIIEWIYAPERLRDTVYTTRWVKNRQVGPLTMAMERISADPDFRIWFTDVGIQLTNEKWIWAD
jgi:hypothetical protein